jgi:hypothetical protein
LKTGAGAFPSCFQKSLTRTLLLHRSAPDTRARIHIYFLQSTVTCKGTRSPVLHPARKRAPTHGTVINVAGLIGISP